MDPECLKSFKNVKFNAYIILEYLIENESLLIYEYKLLKY